MCPSDTDSPMPSKGKLMCVIHLSRTHNKTDEADAAYQIQTIFKNGCCCLADKNLWRMEACWFWY